MQLLPGAGSSLGLQPLHFRLPSVIRGNSNARRAWKLEHYHPRSPESVMVNMSMIGRNLKPLA